MFLPFKKNETYKNWEKYAQNAMNRFPRAGCICLVVVGVVVAGTVCVKVSRFGITDRTHKSPVENYILLHKPNRTFIKISIFKRNKTNTYKF